VEEKSLNDVLGYLKPFDLIKYQSCIERVIVKHPSIPNNYKIIKNIAYNLQMLHFLDQSIAHLDLHIVIKTQSWKSYVVTVFSVVEAILYYLVKTKEESLIKDWELVKEFKSNSLLENGIETRIVTWVQERRQVRITPEIKFTQLSRKAEQNKLLGETELYEKIKVLRKLRNRIHIHTIDDHPTKGTDWNSFNLKSYELAKTVLEEIFLITGVMTADEIHKFGFKFILKSTTSLVQHDDF
jgi:hypothetical protein